MRRPASLLMQTDAREAPGQHRPSAITSGSCECTREAEDAPRQANVRRFRQAGSEANKPPRWSAERRASPGAQTVKASLRGDARACVTGPLLNGCRCTRAPVGAPLPSFIAMRRRKCKRSEGSCLARTMMRAWVPRPPLARVMLLPTIRKRHDPLAPTLSSSRRFGRRARRRPRVRAILSGASGAHHRAGRGRRAERRQRAHGRAKAHRGLGPQRPDREHAGRQREHRHGRRRARRSRTAIRCCSPPAPSPRTRCSTARSPTTRSRILRRSRCWRRGRMCCRCIRRSRRKRCRSWSTW